MKPASKHLSGLQKVCRSMGSMNINNMLMVWDYTREEAVPEWDLRKDKERWAASERIRWGMPPKTCPERMNPTRPYCDKPYKDTPL